MASEKISANVSKLQLKIHRNFIPCTVDFIPNKLAGLKNGLYLIKLFWNKV